MHYEAPNGATTACGMALWSYYCGMAATSNGLQTTCDLQDVDCPECQTAAKEIKYPVTRAQVDSLTDIISDAQCLAITALGEGAPLTRWIVAKLSEAFRLLDDVQGILR